MEWNGFILHGGTLSCEASLQVLHENIYIKIHKFISTTPLLAMICADLFQSPRGENKLIRLRSVSDVDCQNSYSFLACDENTPIES